MGVMAALAAMGIFATHDVVVKTLGALYSPIQIVFFAALLSFPLISIVILQDRSGGSLVPRRPGWVALRTLTMTLTAPLAFYGFSTLPLAQTYAILFSAPLMITLLSIPILGEEVRLRRWLAVIVGLVGVLIALRPGQASLSLGHLATLTAAFTSALSAIIVRKVGTDERPVVLLIYPILGNFFAMGALLPLVYHPMPVGDFALTGVIAVLGLGATFLSIYSYQVGEAPIVAPMQYSQMLWATVYGLFLFNERPDRATLIGSLIIILSGVYIVLRETGGASQNRPVSDARGLSETVTRPRQGLLQRLLQSGRDAG